MTRNLIQIIVIMSIYLSAYYVPGTWSVLSHLLLKSKSKFIVTQESNTK